MLAWPSLLLTGALALASGVRVEPEPSQSAVPGHPTIARVRLDVDPALYPALAEAMTLRLAGMEVERFGAEVGDRGDELEAYVRIRGPSDDAYDVSIVLSDGRAYDREIVAPEAMAARIVGSELAVLMRGIEEETLLPDREDATMPVAGRDEGPAEPLPSTGPSATDATAPTPSTSGRSEASAATDRELGIRAAPGGLLALAPAQDIAASGAGTAMLGLDLRWASGAVLSADLRMGGRRSPPYGLLRTRLAIGGGVVLRRGAFELPILGAVGIEPWSIHAEGRGTAVHPIEGSARQVPLLGVLVRVAPGIRLSIAGRPWTFVRLGPFVELAASAVFSDGVGAPRLHDAETGRVVARLGGLELGLGLSAQLWIRLPSRHGVAPSRPRGELEHHGQVPASVQMTSPPMRSHSQQLSRSPPQSPHGHMSQPGASS